MLAVTPVLASGTLTIDLDADGDTATISVNGANIEVSDGTTTTPFAATSVNRIEVAGSVDANQAVTIDSDLTLPNGLEVDFEIETATLNGIVSGTVAGQLVDLEPGVIILNADIRTSGGDVDLDSPITLLSDVVIDTDVTGGGADAGNVSINSVDGNSTGDEGLTIDARADGGASGGSVSFFDVGQATALAHFDVRTSELIDWLGEEINTDGGDVRLQATVLQTNNASFPNALTIDTESGGDDDAGHVDLDVGFIFEAVVSAALIQVNTGTGAGFQAGNTDVPPGFNQLGLSGDAVVFEDIFINRILVNRAAFEAAFADYGDAPDSYGTLLASDGARHLTLVTDSVLLGSLRDNEANGQPNADANGDDVAVMDEDGVTFPTAFTPNQTAQVSVTLSKAGRLDAWFDFDGNDVFDPGEHINGGLSLTLPAGTQTINVPVPATADSGDTYARFRVSSAGGLDPTGVADDGEVEDYKINIGTIARPEINVQTGGADVLTGDTAPSVGSTLVGTSLTQSFTIQNTGLAELNLTSGMPLIVVGGAHPGDFAITTAPSTPIPAINSQTTVQTTTFVVTFTPTAAGLRTATLSIANDDVTGGEDPYVINIQGAGVAIAPEINVQVAGSDVASGGAAADVGSTDGAINVTVAIQNTGTSALNLTGTPLVTVAGANPAEFVVTQPAANTIPASGSINFNVAFMPTALGTRSATLSIANNDGDENPYIVNLTGTSVTPEINVQVDGVDVATGGTAASFGTTGGTITKPVTIQNTGTDALALTGTPIVEVTGANAADFNVTQPTANSVAASSDTTFNVAFTPTNNGLRTATLSIANSDADEDPYTVVLQGTGSGFSTVLPFDEDFNDGVAEPEFTTESGSFNVINGNEFSGTRTNGTNAISTLDLGALPTQGVTVNATVRTSAATGGAFSNGFIVFDYQDNSNFKLAGIEAKNNRLVISRVVNGSYARIASTASGFANGVDHALELQITNNQVFLTANGSINVSASVSNPLDGKVGIGTINADTVFDDVSVTTP